MRVWESLPVWSGRMDAGHRRGSPLACVEVRPSGRLILSVGEKSRPMTGVGFRSGRNHGHGVSDQSVRNGLT